MKRECIFIDAFTDVPYAGNQLAVFPHGEGLNTGQMQKLAQEINYSESVFILKTNEKEADFEVRIFTVTRELPFAGHPVLGTAHSIMNILDIWPPKKDVLKLKTKAGIIPLEKSGGDIWMTQNKPEFPNRYTDKEEIAGLVNLTPEDIADNLPIEAVSTGNTILIVPIRDLATIQHASGHMNRMQEFFQKNDVMAPYLFTLETVNRSAGVHTRMLAAHMGLQEDPATGSAAGPLTAYLLKHDVFGSKFNIENEQGIEMGRPSKLLMKGEIKDSKYIIKVGGACAYVGRGEFEI